LTFDLLRRRGRLGFRELRLGRLLLVGAHRIEAAAQRLHQVHDLRRLLGLRRDDLLPATLASMICRSPSWYSSL
jgi:hypothetical protein